MTDLYYFRDHHGNFGDALNDWLWDALLPNRKEQAPGLWLSGIGTILNHKMPAGRRWAIMGSGVGYGGLPRGFGGPDWDVLALRGPLSAQRLGVEPDRAVTDAAMLLSLLPDYAPAATARAERKGIAFIPHYMSVRGSAWREACHQAGLTYIDPCSDSRAILAAVGRSELVIADAMHGAIAADILRTPWVPASINRTTDSFKWTDWCLSMGLTHQPDSLLPSTLSDLLKNKALGLYGEDFLCTGADHDTLCRRHERRSAGAGSPVRALRNKLVKRLVREGAEGAMALERTLAAPVSARRIERAAAALAALGRRRPCLSAEATFREKRDRMAEALATLAQRHGIAASRELAL